MKKQHLFLGAVLSASLLFSSAAFAAETGTTKDIPVGMSSQVEMVGTIEPTILSVTMPSFVPFNISNSVTTQNKVISPRINVKNNSNIPIEINVGYTEIDISKLSGTTWSDNGTVSDNQIAIGLKEEVTENVMPADLNSAHWLPKNQYKDINVMILDANKNGVMYVVGTMGSSVSESATFKVTPTFVVKRI